ncbi:MAG: DUF1501 domain-containing protein [Planctomycetia bacterium]|nr:DUF1501 domain-containing protein [Planctomycetia bacterium]
MIRILGTPRRLCDGLTRRDLLHIGGLGAFGVALSDLFGLAKLSAASGARPSGFGKAKSCILLYKYGSPSQHETFDPKPDAPAEIQGEMRAIATRVPGIRICEHLPRIAKIMNRLTVVRSLTHPYPLHGTVYAMSGIPEVDVKIESKPRDPRQWPFIGSIVDYVEDQRNRGRLPDMPRNIALPFRLGARTEIPPLAGPYGTWLGSRYDPIFTEFTAAGVRPAPAVGAFVCADPYLSIRPTDRITLGSDAAAPEGMDSARVDVRRSLLRQFDRARAWLEADERVEAFSQQQRLAFSLLTTGNVHRALDLAREPLAVRENYGMNLFGQSTLAARRLIEAGCKFVTVFFDAFGRNTGGWDTHDNHFPRLKNFLLPVFDQTYAALILDLEARGLLDETLVLCLSEHGRTPRLESSRHGAGRDHWSRAYCQVYAGAGMGQGNLVGRTDAIAGDVTSTPLSPKDILATAFYLLGIDPHTNIQDRTGQPMPIVGNGSVRPELLG